MADDTNIVNLHGTFNHKVDAKGRVSLPASYRKVLSSDLVITRSPEDDCLYVFEPAAFDEWVTSLFEDKFGGFKSSSKLHVKLRRKLNGRARDVEIDGSGRVQISADLREAVGIGREVVIAGDTGHFEIWDAARYAQEDEDVDLGMLFD